MFNRDFTFTVNPVKCIVVAVIVFVSIGGVLWAVEGPELPKSKDSLDALNVLGTWVSGLATFAAAVVALWLGRRAEVKVNHDAWVRGAVAAIQVEPTMGRSVSVLMRVLEVLGRAEGRDRTRCLRAWQVSVRWLASIEQPLQAIRQFAPDLAGLHPNCGHKLLAGSQKLTELRTRLERDVKVLKRGGVLDLGIGEPPIATTHEHQAWIRLSEAKLGFHLIAEVHFAVLEAVDKSSGRKELLFNLLR